MRTPIGSRMAASVSAGIVSAALLFGGAAHAITDTVFQYATPRTGHFMMPAAAFAVQNSAAGGYVNNGAAIVTANNCFVAPVNVPDGASITAVAFWYVKASATSFTVKLSRRTVSDGMTILLVDKAAAGTGGVRKGASVGVSNVSLQAVNNQQFQYAVQACMTNVGDSFEGARVTYTYTTAGD